MAETAKSESVIYVYADSHAYESPRMRALQAEKLVQKYLGAVGVDVDAGTDPPTLYFPPVGEAYEQTEAQQLIGADLHITIAGGHCGKEDCARCDPMERYVDGATVRECLAAYQRMQRESHTHRQQYTPVSLGGVHMTPRQLDAAKAAWSASLKRMQSERREKERVSVVVERDEDGE